MEVLQLVLKHKYDWKGVSDLRVVPLEVAKSMRCFLQTLAAAAVADAAAIQLDSYTFSLTRPEIHVLIAYAMLVSGGVCKQLFHKSA